LHAAVTRQRADGSPPGGWHPSERISLNEAVYAYTVGSYEAVGRTDVGRLAVGQLADLIAVDRDAWSRPRSATRWCSGPSSAAGSPSRAEDARPERPARRPAAAWRRASARRPPSGRYR
jgi:cytosine/adenosine deaminase-related metal-dependent hydrolase